MDEIWYDVRRYNTKLHGKFQLTWSESVWIFTELYEITWVQIFNEKNRGWYC